MKESKNAARMLVELGQIEGPIWRDDCNHGKNAYVASFELPEMIRGVLVCSKYDLYVWQHHESEDSRLCIRFSDEPSECHSPTSIIETALAARAMPMYFNALRLIQRLGVVTFKKREG